MIRYQIANIIRRLVGFFQLTQRLQILKDAQSADHARLMNKIEQIEQKLGVLAPNSRDSHANDGKKISPVQHYGERNLWELPIQICAIDCVSADDTVLDIGGNIGALATAFSKIFPEGQIYTFEPNPDLWPVLHETLVVNDARNVTIVPLACFSESLKLETFYSEDSFYRAGSRLGDEIIGSRKFHVTTVSIDDFCIKNSLLPSFIKIDVEGAEIQVLRSAKRTLDKHRPVIIFEYRSNGNMDDSDPMSFLSDWGYQFYDINTYDSVSPEFYQQLSSPTLANVLAIPDDSPVAQRYSTIEKEVVFRIDVSNQHILETQPIPLEPGRYVVSVDFVMSDDVDGGLSIKHGGKLVAHYGAKGLQLKEHSNSNLVLNLQDPAEITVELSNPQKDDARLCTIEIHHLNFKQIVQ